jgi:hypothetical protein
MPVPAAARPSRADAPTLAYNLGAIMLALALAGIALAYAIDAARRNAHSHPHPGDGEAVLTRTLGGRELQIPTSWFRYAEKQADGFAKRIELRLVLPLGEDGASRAVDVTLLPRSSVRPSAKLLDGVYLHMFEATELSGPQGLIGKPLKAAEGYENETVWYDPLSGDPFVAKCEASVGSKSEPRCLRAVYLAPGIAAVYAFDYGLLENWRKFDAEIQPWLERIGVVKP